MSIRCAAPGKKRMYIHAMILFSAELMACFLEMITERCHGREDESL
ncbi:hypothetical protein CLOSTHATH_06534 [Hungatella hathewayi DSM 13479]|uniref:Uncharacterized protein n=1 Tax=Hungatella hathewayi DSM 13479 TaxID=566550 RepID=D3ASC6_9FIRM|nr:hypothetical protein CLOSTHATH_06534 [Hungatella hathewayi DSM 13479]